MSKFTMQFNCDNAAFYDQDEDFDVASVAHILGEVRHKVASGEVGGNIRDINGNRVGSWELDIDPS
jgi:hypothetical protein